MKPRCPHCGAKYASWNRDTLIAAGHAWLDKHGVPPRTTDWGNGVPEHPSKATVYRVYGSWGAFMDACGFKRGNQRWSQERIVHAVFEWRFEHGQLPTSWDWDGATDTHPSRKTVNDHFGSWNAMLVAAGYEANRPVRSLRSYRNQAATQTRHRDHLGRLAPA